MRYYKSYDESYIATIGTGFGGTEITKTEYDEIMAVIQSRPNGEGKGYRLRTDLTWEEYDLPPAIVSDADELSTDEAMAILLGGAQ